MKRTLLDMLADPLEHGPVRVEGATGPVAELESGSLVDGAGRRYPVRNGIPRFVAASDAAQTQTSAAFAFKWKKRDTYDSPAARQNALGWYLEKYGFTSRDAWVDEWQRFGSILDLGCGSGFSSSLWLESERWTGRVPWVGVDISEAIDVAQERLGKVGATHFVQGDALALPFVDGCFDLVYSEGALHHTRSTRAALLSGARVLAKGGECHFYVYRRKAPVREFTDDFVRAQLSELSDDAAWEAMRALTRLAQVLAEAKVTVTVPEDVSLLELRAGEYDVQRLIYWTFGKLYWNVALSFEENVHVNFDWYRPLYAHRQTAAEVRQWCAEAGLVVHWFHEQESGITVRARKP